MHKPQEKPNFGLMWDPSYPIVIRTHNRNENGEVTARVENKVAESAVVQPMGPVPTQGATGVKQPLCALCMCPIEDSKKCINHCALGQYHQSCLTNMAVVRSCMNDACVQCCFCNQAFDMQQLNPQVSSIMLQSQLLSSISPKSPSDQKASICYLKSVIRLPSGGISHVGPGTVAIPAAVGPKAVPKTVAKVCRLCLRDIMPGEGYFTHIEGEDFHCDCISKWFRIRAEDAQFFEDALINGVACPFCDSLLPNSYIDTSLSECKDSKPTTDNTLTLSCCKQKINRSEFKAVLCVRRFKGIFGNDFPFRCTSCSKNLCWHDLAQIVDEATAQTFLESYCAGCGKGLPKDETSSPGFCATKHLLCGECLSSHAKCKFCPYFQNLVPHGL